MGVDLSLGSNTAVYETESGDCTVKILGIPVGLAERKLFSERSFVDLDDADTILLKIQYLIADSESDLQSAFLKRDVFSRE